MRGKVPNPWFRFYSEFEDDPEVQMMSEAMQLRLVKTFCTRCKEQTLTDKARAFKWHITPQELAETKAFFIENGFIDENWNVLNWNKRQFISDSSTVRTARYRERKRTSQERHGDVGSVTPVTKRDAVEAEAEAEAESEEIRREQIRLEQRRTEAARPTGKGRGAPSLASVSSIFSNGATVTPRRFPTTVAGLLAGGYSFSNKAACHDCGQEIDWWLTPKGGQLPMNVDSAVVHMETCTRALSRAQ